MEIHPLTHLSTDSVINTFQEAFSDYAVCFGNKEIKEMLRRRGYNPELSFGAFENGSVIAFILNGTGLSDNRMCAYDCGTGTLPGYRGKGIAGQLFSASLPALREAGISHYVLEVLRSNGPAISLYRRQGFDTTAEYDCFKADKRELRLSGRQPQGTTEIVADGIGIVETFDTMCEFRPSWQNSIASIRRGADSLVILSARFNGETAGCCVFDPFTGDIARLIVAPHLRRRGIGSAMMDEAVRQIRCETVKMLNVSSDCTSLHRFLEAINLTEALPQFEMRLTL